MPILAIFEDSLYENFLPVVATRPVFELRCGALTLRERIEQVIERAGIEVGRKLLFMREYLAPLYRRLLEGYEVNSLEKIDDDVILVNGRLVALQDVLRLLERLPSTSVAIFEGDELVLARLRPRLLEDLGELLLRPVGEEFTELLRSAVEKFEVRGQPLVRAPWELFDLHAKALQEDAGRIAGGTAPEAKILGPSGSVVVLGEVEERVVIDVRQGPVVIGERAVVESPARLIGPVFVGRGARVQGAVVSNAVIGPKTLVQGFVEQSIVQGYADILPGSFVRTSYLGEWTLVGPCAALADVKLTLGSIKFRFPRFTVDTQLMELGAFVGDVARVAAGAAVYPGCKIGVAAHVHGVVFDDVPAFTIWARPLVDKLVGVSLESALETLRRMSILKGELLPPEAFEVLRHVYRITEVERRDRGVEAARFPLGRRG